MPILIPIPILPAHLVEKRVVEIALQESEKSLHDRELNDVNSSRMSIGVTEEIELVRNEHEMLTVSHPSTIPVLSQYYPSTIPVLSQYYPSTIPVLSQYYPSTIPVLSQYYPSTIPVLSQYQLSTNLVLPQY